MRRPVVWLFVALAVLGPVGLLVVPAVGMVMVTGMASEDDGASEVVPVLCGDPAGEAVELPAGEQRENAAVIVATGVRLGVPEQGLVVAIATARQESTLRNLNYGDRDSLGLFQQRAPWGSVADRTTPRISAELFFTGGRGGQPGLLDIAGWEGMSVAAAAQAVQVSAFPDAYAQWEPLARAVVSQVLGSGPVQECTPEGGSGACSASTDLTGFQNGRIPDAALCEIGFAPGHRLRSDAALALERLDRAYESAWGSHICITDSYRDYPTQVRLRAEKGRWAAVPGTSNHGWGQAVDLCGGIQSFGAAQHRWMQVHAPGFGWVHPSWAGPSGSLPEPWHWEFGT